MKTSFDIVVVGGGIVGLASAYKFLESFSDISNGVTGYWRDNLPNGGGTF